MEKVGIGVAGNPTFSMINSLVAAGFVFGALAGLASSAGADAVTTATSPLDASSRRHAFSAACVNE